ncbi:unnamed protein product [Rotaria socialis]
MPRYLKLDTNSIGRLLYLICGNVGEIILCISNALVSDTFTDQLYCVKISFQATLRTIMSDHLQKSQKRVAASIDP